MKKNNLQKLGYAVLTLPGGGSNIDKSIPELIVFYMDKYVIPIAIALALGAFIYGGFLYITSAGEEEKAKTGRYVISLAVVGVVLLTLSLVIINWLQTMWNTVL